MIKSFVTKSFPKNSFTLCPIFIGQKLYGPCQAPKILSNTLSKIQKFDDFKYYNLKFHNAYHECDHEQNLRNILRYNNDIYTSNQKSLSGHNLNINLGGDHSIAIGSVSASLNKYNDDLVVIWIDAHADINSMQSSSSKNVHGMPLSILTRPLQYELPLQRLKYNQIIYIGLRDCDDFEIKLIQDNQIRHWTSHEINELDRWSQHRTGFINLLKTLTQDKKIHVSLDVDALDPKYIPCTGTSVENGISMDFVTNLISNLKNNIVNADIVELNLDLKTDEDKEKSLDNTIELISSFI
jgi:arginase